MQRNEAEVDELQGVRAWGQGTARGETNGPVSPPKGSFVSLLPLPLVHGHGNISTMGCRCESRGSSQERDGRPTAQGRWFQEVSHDPGGWWGTRWPRGSLSFLRLSPHLGRHPDRPERLARVPSLFSVLFSGVGDDGLAEGHGLDAVKHWEVEEGVAARQMPGQIRCDRAETEKAQQRSEREAGDEPRGVGGAGAGGEEV